MSANLSFGETELGLLDKALNVAEDSVSDFYRLSDGFWIRHPYELRTLEELLPEEVTAGALAQVLKLRQPQGPGRLRARDFYRICFQDHNFLELMRQEGDRAIFLPLLTYVMVHELVHVVRFSKFLQLFESEAQARDEEEATVHRISSRVLSRVRLPELERVLNCYQNFAAAQPAIGHC